MVGRKSSCPFTLLLDVVSPFPTGHAALTDSASMIALHLMEHGHMAADVEVCYRACSRIRSLVEAQTLIRALWLRVLSLISTASFRSCAAINK